MRPIRNWLTPDFITISKKGGIFIPPFLFGIISTRHPGESRFTARYNVDQLVYYEIHDDVENAIKREKSMKEWKRDWKIALIEKDNPEWRDLYLFITG